MAYYFKWNIQKIHLYPFGGSIKFDELINNPIKEELYILLAGPIFQITFYLIVNFFYSIGFVSTNTMTILYNYHYAILLFNLLPIFPLDGSKLFNLLIAKILPFKLSHLLTIYISYISLAFISISMLYIHFNITLYLLLFLLLYKVIEERKNHNNIFNKFLLERYLYNFPFKKIKIIWDNKIQSMMRDKKHFFYHDKKYISEKTILRNKYNNKVDVK